MNQAQDAAHDHSLALYWKIYAALMALLILTVGAAYIHFGPFNLVVALAIAFTKTALVIIYFMHVGTSPRLIWLFSVIGFVWMSYLLVGVFGDVMTRPWF